MNQWQQLAFRGRKDDGVESLQESDGGATWEGALNADYSWNVADQTRLRFLINSNVERDSGLQQLWYNKNGGGYSRVTAVSSDVQVASTTHYSHNDHSTNFTGRLGVNLWTDATNFALASDGISVGDWHDNGGSSWDMEPEWCLKLVEADVSDGDTILFRMRKGSGATFEVYNNTPTLTVVKPSAAAQSMIILTL